MCFGLGIVLGGGTGANTGSAFPEPEELGEQLTTPANKSFPTRGECFHRFLDH